MLNFKKFSSNEDGNVAMMFSIAFAGILGLAGIGMDYTNIVRLKSDLQAQVDAAVLAAATADVTVEGNRGLDQNQVNAIRQKAAFSVLEANGFDLNDIQPRFEISQGTVLLTAKTIYKPFFGGLIGQDAMKISATAESGLGEMQAVEIVLVLDNTNSMIQDGKLAALKTAATNLVNAVEESGSGSEVALVPFARYVKIDESLWDAPWFDRPEDIDTEITWQQATHTGGTCHTVTDTRFRDGFEEEFETQVCEDQTTTYEEMTRVDESRFEGCVGTRTPPFSESDASYGVKVPGLLNRIPSQHTGLNRHLNSHCPRAIIPLTDDYTDLKSEISYLYGTDNTYIPSGLLWGQRVLSPGVPFDNEESENPKRKVMVLMTDGKNTSRLNNSTNAQTYRFAPPYLEWLGGDGHSPEANEVTARMCENIKNDGVEIVTIAFQVNDVATQNLLKNCASDASSVYTAESNQALIDAFESISNSLDESIRLIR